MKNLIVRAVTGTLFVALVLGSILFDHRAATAVFGLFMLLGLIEFYKLFQSHRTIEIDWRIGAFFGVLIFGLGVGSLYNLLPLISFSLIIPLSLIMMLTELWRKKKNPILNSTIQIAGIFYVVLPFFLVVWMNYDESMRFLYDDTTEFLMPRIASMFILIWTNDTFAYLTGRVIGKTKLFERISPNKTWEGTIGGVVFTMLAGFLIGSYLPTYDSYYFWIGAALIVAPCAILGDLYESLVKRSLKIKDSGSILPGHGGILDRFDAMFFTVPFFMAWTFIYPYIWGQ